MAGNTFVSFVYLYMYFNICMIIVRNHYILVTVVGAEVLFLCSCIFKSVCFRHGAYLIYWLLQYFRFESGSYVILGFV